MLSTCVTLALLLGCVMASPQHQYQQHPEGVPPHLLRQYLAAQQAADAAAQVQSQAQTQVIPKPVPARIPYSVQGEPQYQQQYQQPQVQYRTQPQPQPQYRPQPQPQPQYQRPQELKDPKEDYDPSPSYQFGFDVNDDLNTNYQNRKEQRDGDVIKGSYSVVDSDGFIRTVTYTADPKEGFKAEVSRQPTDIVVKIPTPKPQIRQPQVLHAQPQPQPQHQHQHQHQYQPQQQQEQEQQYYQPRYQQVRP